MTRDCLGSTLFVVLLCASVSVAGCAGVPVDESLQQARQRMQSARADETLRSEAAGPFADAERTLAKAGEADDPALRYHFTYLAGKNLDIAEAIVARKRAEHRLAELRRHREEAAAATVPSASKTVQVEPVPPPAPDDAMAESGMGSKATPEVDAGEADRLVRDLEQERRRMATREDRDGGTRAEDPAKTKQKIEPQKAREPAIRAPAEIHFTAGATELSPGAKRRLDPIVAQLRQNPEVSVVVEGHTDSSGTHEANLKTSLARAYAVKAYLVDNGVASERVQTLGLGAAYPVANDKSEEGRQRNRRAEIVFDPSARTVRSPSRRR